MSISVKFFTAGYCTHPEAILIQSGRWRTSRLPAIFALIQHPLHGFILFDTGYSNRFFQETRRFPFRFYAMITPVLYKTEDSAVYQLKQQGIPPEAINYIIVSHFHADHVGGLPDFPNAHFIYFKSAYEAVKHRQGIRAVMAGFLAGLLPLDFEKRAILVEDKQLTSLPPAYAPFDIGFDLFGDGSLLAVELPGHATGQLGLCFKDINHQTYFLIADACWLSRAYQELLTPHPLANFILANKQEYRATLKKIHQLSQLNPKIKIIPTHCPDAWNQLRRNALVETSSTLLENLE